MKPLSEKNYTEQALANGKGITWLDNCRIPKAEGDRTEYGVDGDEQSHTGDENGTAYGVYNRVAYVPDENGRFPANLLVSDDVLNDGIERKSNRCDKPSDCSGNTWGGTIQVNRGPRGYNDSGSFSRFFDLDIWWSEKIKQLPESVQKTFPYLIVPKAAKSEKNKGCEGLEKTIGHNRFDICSNCGGTILQNPDRPSACKCEEPERQDNVVKGNFHPTTKPLRLMSYLISLGSRAGDIILDPFLGSGTTALASRILNRKCIGIELNPEYYQIAEARLKGSFEEIGEVKEAKESATDSSGGFF